MEYPAMAEHKDGGDDRCADGPDNSSFEADDAIEAALIGSEAKHMKETASVDHSQFRGERVGRCGGEAGGHGELEQGSVAVPNEAKESC
jgi:hypothetical protein